MHQAAKCNNVLSRYACSPRTLILQVGQETACQGSDCLSFLPHLTWQFVAFKMVVIYLIIGLMTSITEYR